MHILVCSLEGQKYGVDLACVERGIQAVSIKSIPNTAPYILGALNIHNDIVPVINLRQLLGLPMRELDVNDHFVLCTVHNKRVALWVDHVNTVRECSSNDLQSAQEIFPVIQGSAEYMLKEDKEITLLFDLDRLIPVGS